MLSYSMGERKTPCLKIPTGAGETAQQLRGLSGLPGDPS